MFKALISILCLTSSLLAAEDFSKGEGRNIFVGPSFKIWCSLTQKGQEKVGKKLILKTGNILTFPKDNTTGHLPKVNAKDFSKKEEISLLFKNLKSLCVEDMNALSPYIDKNLKTWIDQKITSIDLRGHDEILWDFYDERAKKDQTAKACKIRRAFNVKKTWIVSYPEVVEGCL